MKGAIAMLIASAAMVLPAPGQVIFHDDFEAEALDPSLWRPKQMILHRSHFGALPELSDGLAHIHVDTFDATYPGQLFSVVDIETVQLFSRNDGLEFETRARLGPGTPRGMVAAFFTYEFNPAKQTQDEIDFEIVTNYLTPGASSQPILLSTWNDWDYIPAHANDQIHHAVAAPFLPGYDPEQFNTYTFRWLPDRVEWLVNGQQVWMTTAAIPDEPMRAKLDFWVPNTEWADAYNPQLQPVGLAALNERFTFDVDYVTVRSIPEPSALGTALIGLAGIAWWLRRARK